MVGSCLLSLVHSGRVVRALALARRCVVGGFIIRRAESIYRVRGGSMVGLGWIGPYKMPHHYSPESSPACPPRLAGPCCSTKLSLALRASPLFAALLIKCCRSFLSSPLLS